MSRVLTLLGPVLDKEARDEGVGTLRNAHNNSLNHALHEVRANEAVPVDTQARLLDPYARQVLGMSGADVLTYETEWDRMRAQVEEIRRNRPS